ncbi:MAG TPA: hypothetical protein VNT30_09915 [Stellaceae bacterium]|nr:hypothetical protein [Stellaceae bacterium]
MIKFDGTVRGVDDSPVEIFVIEAEGDQFWFEVSYEFNQDGNDFHVMVDNFGLRSKMSAGAASFRRRYFADIEKQEAEIKLRILFQGDKNNPSLPFVPFHMPRSTCLGVKFKPGWIETH